MHQRLCSENAYTADRPVRLCSGSRPRYMTPAEVREVLKRMWQRNTDILSLLYAVENKNVPHSNKIHTKYEDIYEMFFVQTVPVAPSKFRAPSKLGDQVFEHPQNTLLVTIINANLDLVSLSDKAVTDPANENEVCFRHCFLHVVATLMGCEIKQDSIDTPYTCSLDSTVGIPTQCQVLDPAIELNCRTQSAQDNVSMAHDQMKDNALHP